MGDNVTPIDPDMELEDPGDLPMVIQPYKSPAQRGLRHALIGIAVAVASFFLVNLGSIVAQNQGLSTDQARLAVGLLAINVALLALRKFYAAWMEE